MRLRSLELAAQDLDRLLRDQRVRLSTHVRLRLEYVQRRLAEAHKELHELVTTP